MKLWVKKGSVKLNKGAIAKKAEGQFAGMLRDIAIATEVETRKSMSEGGAGGPPSPVGEPPRVQTGNLLANTVARKVHNLRWKIGFARPAFYGAIHELSERYPRPSLRPAFLRVMDRFGEMARRHGLRWRFGGRRR